jgi:hypothetical protein
MKTEITLAEVAGKTVEKMGACEPGNINYSRQFIITFTDNTFIVVGVEMDYDSVTVDVQKLDEGEFGRDTLMHFGIVTQEEFDERDRQKAMQRKLDQENADYREFQAYQRLKEQFEGVDELSVYKNLKAKFEGADRH